MLNISNGIYPAIASGFQTTFAVQGVAYVSHHTNGVKGMNIPDEITVTDDGIVSRLLGEAITTTPQVSAS